MDENMPPTPELYSAVPGDTGDMPVPELINETMPPVPGDMPTPELYVNDMQDVELYTGTNAIPMDGLDTGAVVAGGAVFGVMMIFYFAIIILMIVSIWKVFTKANQPGWASIIPFYNLYVMLQIAGKPGWWLILFFIPFVNIVMIIIMIHGVSKAFGKGAGYTIGLIFLGIIFFPMLAFGSATYTRPVGEGDGGNVTPPQNPVPPQQPQNQTM